MTCAGALSFLFHSTCPLPVPQAILRLVMFPVVLNYSFTTPKLEQSTDDMLSPGEAQYFASGVGSTGSADGLFSGSFPTFA